MRETKKIPIKQLKVGDTFHTFIYGHSTNFASYEIVEMNNLFVTLKIFDKREETYYTEDAFVEIELSEEEIRAKYNEEARVNCEKIKTPLPTVGNYGYHEIWNGWIAVDPWELAANLREHHLTLLGYYILPEPKFGFFDDDPLDAGIVVEDADGEVFWCHTKSRYFQSMIEAFELYNSH